MCDVRQNTVYSNLTELAQKQTMTLSKNEYDICIIGAGPAGLATLSAIKEPYSMDSMNENIQL